MTFRTNKSQRRLEGEEPVSQVLDQGHRRTERDREGDLPLLAPLLILPVRSLTYRQGAQGTRTDSDDAFKTTSASPFSH